MMKQAKWEVYIIQANSGKLYTGITKDVSRRFAEHRTERKGARFFRFSAPKNILFREIYTSRSEATQREIQIKKMSRKQKFDMIDASKAIH
jgi:putative endonuclease